MTNDGDGQLRAILQEIVKHTNQGLSKEAAEQLMRSQQVFHTLEDSALTLTKTSESLLELIVDDLGEKLCQRLEYQLQTDDFDAAIISAREIKIVCSFLIHQEQGEAVAEGIGLAREACLAIAAQRGTWQLDRAEAVALIECLPRLSGNDLKAYIDWCELQCALQMISLHDKSNLAPAELFEKTLSFYVGFGRTVQHREWSNSLDWEKEFAALASIGEGFRNKISATTSEFNLPQAIEAWDSMLLRNEHHTQLFSFSLIDQFYYLESCLRYAQELNTLSWCIDNASQEHPDVSELSERLGSTATYAINVRGCREFTVRGPLSLWLRLPPEPGFIWPIGGTHSAPP